MSTLAGLNKTFRSALSYTMINTSLFTLEPGDIVIYDPVNTPYGVTTTTTIGDNTVAGVVITRSSPGTNVELLAMGIGPINTDASVLSGDQIVTGAVPRLGTNISNAVPGTAITIVGTAITNRENGQNVVLVNLTPAPVGDGSGGAATFVALSDTPANYISAGDYAVTVNTGETALAFRKLNASAFASFDTTFDVTINGGPFNGLTIVEKGYTIPSFNITWATTDIDFPITAFSNFELDGTPISMDGGYSLATGGTYTPGAPIGEGVVGTGFAIDFTDGATTVSKADTIEFQSRVFYGTSVNPGPLVEADIEALASSGLQADKNGTYAMGAGGYKYICWPTAYGTQALNLFKDTATQLNVAMDPTGPYTVSVTNAYGYTQNYYVYRSEFVLGGAITISVS